MSVILELHLQTPELHTSYVSDFPGNPPSRIRRGVLIFVCALLEAGRFSPLVRPEHSIESRSIELFPPGNPDSFARVSGVSYAPNHTQSLTLELLSPRGNRVIYLVSNDSLPQLGQCYLRNGLCRAASGRSVTLRSQLIAPGP